eukprot:scaffold92004_cov21-Tisochrysis_lutea.AAC.2
MLGRSTPQFSTQHSWHHLPHPTKLCAQHKVLRLPPGQRSDLSVASTGQSVVELTGTTSDMQEASTTSRGRMLIVGGGPAGEKDG